MTSDREHLWYAAAARFEAARSVDVLPEGHRSRGLHGHSFLARVRADLPPGWAPFEGGETDELQRRLQLCVATLDYTHLNSTVGTPTDENLARWIREHLDVPGLRQVGVQCTDDSGVDLDINEDAHVWRRYDAHVWRRYRFESAHQLPNVPPGHKCGRMHGHGFEVILHANQSLGARDLSIDYDHLDAIWAPLHAELDHACLNDITGLANPTSEVISSWIWDRLKPVLPELSWVTVYETASCGAQYDGTHYRIWKEMTLDSAVRLRRAPEGDPRRRVHGHTFTLRLHLCAPLDEVLGWTVDFGDVKTIFDPLFKRLDHHPLHELTEIDDSDVASLARYMREKTQTLLPALDRIDLYQTRGCGVLLSWGEHGPSLPV
jgi:6-pyruvoyltetrahydropterin/6-carboxytetrahydropterin synthase